MYKKLLLVSIACLLSFMFSDAAWSSVVGTWDVTGVVKLKASAKGRSVSVTVPYVDTFTFGADSSFSMIGMGGTYTVKKKKFTVDFPNADIEGYLTSALLDAFSDSGYVVNVNSVVLTKESIKGTENLKDGTIKGTMKFSVSADVFIENYGIRTTIKASATSVFLGSNHVPLVTSSAEPGKTLTVLLREQVVRSLIEAGVLPSKQ